MSWYDNENNWILESLYSNYSDRCGPLSHVSFFSLTLNYPVHTRAANPSSANNAVQYADLICSPLNADGSVLVWFNLQPHCTFSELLAYSGTSVSPVCQQLCHLAVPQIIPSCTTYLYLHRNIHPSSPTLCLILLSKNSSILAFSKMGRKKNWTT